MDEARQQMLQALKVIVVPKLRSLGFTGSNPHFRRKKAAEHQVVMLMFNRYGGSFYLEAGRLSDGEWTDLQAHWLAAGKPLTESLLTVGHCRWDRRERFGGTSPNDPSDHWFVFGPDRYGEFEHASPLGSNYEAIASKVVEAVDRDLERYFAGAL